MSNSTDTHGKEETAATPPVEGIRIPEKQLKFLDAAQRIEEIDAIDRDDIGFSARLWAQTSLPNRDPGQTAMWYRQNGDTTLSIQPAPLVDAKGNPYVGYPYGMMPRYLMIWMATEAVRTSSRTLYLGENLSQFMKKLGISSTGGKNGSIRHFNDQMQRLFGSTLSINRYSETDTERVVSGEKMSVASKMDLFFSKNDPDSTPLFQSSLTLTEEFYRTLDGQSIPIDMHAINGFRSKNAGPLALDIYIWLCARLPRIPRSKPVHIPWELLHRQFGSDIKHLKHFRPRFLKRLEYVKYVYQDANVIPDRDKLTLKYSPPAIERKRQ